MIQTDKYKKEIIGLIQKASEINAQLGEYKSHYLTRNARFTVMLSNGHVEMDVDVVRTYAQNQEFVLSFKLNKIASSFSNSTKSPKRARSIDSKWDQLFATDTRFIKRLRGE